MDTISYKCACVFITNVITREAFLPFTSYVLVLGRQLLKNVLHYNCENYLNMKIIEFTFNKKGEKIIICGWILIH